MRKSCLNCVGKHLAQACILISESELGYPHHKYYAIGHLAEASDEAIQLWPDLAREIRAARKLYEDEDTVIKFDYLLEKLELLYED